ncbi:hypothetical protein TanjilG_25503 [Lupinus angustifolius]|uniref:Uncharacterized protein n=1 Tax=Lupinus angustifolius TaxID=3871 RepID=A0A1J7GJD2_LUPAN|nr:hypothetical protein TanjilG_23236 [Lupinus angustifolius]OIV94441.1 hypothetical protein TanjilG_25503 [Lupinus angustifolius]
MVRRWQRQGAEYFPTTRLLSRVPSLPFFGSVSCGGDCDSSVMSLQGGGSRWFGLLFSSTLMGCGSGDDGSWTRRLSAVGIPTSSLAPMKVNSSPSSLFVSYSIGFGTVGLLFGFFR